MAHHGALYTAGGKARLGQLLRFCHQIRQNLGSVGAVNFFPGSVRPLFPCAHVCKMRLLKGKMIDMLKGIMVKLWAEAVFLPAKAMLPPLQRRRLCLHRRPFSPLAEALFMPAWATFPPCRSNVGGPGICRYKDGTKLRIQRRNKSVENA